MQLELDAKEIPPHLKKFFQPIGLKPKDTCGIPWMVAFALRADGWYLRSEIIWHKRAPMPESVTDRPTKAHEQLFLLSKSPKYYYDQDAIREPHKREWDESNGRGIYAGKNNANQKQNDMPVLPHPNGANRRSVWTLGPESYSGAHFATMPTKLVEPCILAGSKPGDTVLDPFCGSGTTLAVALKHGRCGVGVELNESYIALAHKRIGKTQPMLLEVTA
jgi:DNA modification methylase